MDKKNKEKENTAHKSDCYKLLGAVWTCELHDKLDTTPFNSQSQNNND